MARWSSLLFKVWIHSSLVHLPLEVEQQSERAAQSLLALWSSGHLIPLWMNKRREKQGSMPIFNNFLLLIWATVVTSSCFGKLAPNIIFQVQLLLLILLLLNGGSCMQAYTRISQLLLCLRADLKVLFRLQCSFSTLMHSIITLHACHWYVPASLDLHYTLS